MSAVERLRAFQSFTNPNHGPTPMWVATAVLDALPEIVAVVEAAEPYIQNAAPHEQLFNGQDLRDFQRLDAALAALDEALTTKGER